MQSSVPARTLTSERLQVSRKRRTLEGFYTVYTQMQNSLSSHIKRRMFSHQDKMSCKQLLTRAWTLRKPKYLAIHKICERLKETIPEVEILSFRAITGCDTGHSKKTSKKKFTEHNLLLRNLGNGDLDDLTMTSTEKFICRVMI